MKLTTRHFGEIEVHESKIIIFEDGLPGFEDLRKFALFHDENEAADHEDSGSSAVSPASVFQWLQSLEDGDVSFVLLNTFIFMPDYDPEIDDNALETLGDFEPSDLIVRNIAVISDKLENMTVNLCAPIVINESTQKGKQVVALNKEYHVKHRIIQETRETAI